MSEAKQSQSRIFFEKKDEAFSQKTKTQKIQNLIADGRIYFARSDSIQS